MSNIDAALRLVMPYSSAISAAMGFAMTMATVLLAVAISIAPTRSPMPSCPPFFPRKTFLIPRSSASKPPYSRMRAQMAETKMATIVVSNISSAPVPIFFSRLVAAISPDASIITEPERMPIDASRHHGVLQ